MRKPIPKLTNKDLIRYLQHFQTNAETSVSYDTLVRNTIIRDVDSDGFKLILDEVINALQSS